MDVSINYAIHDLHSLMQGCNDTRIFITTAALHLCLISVGFFQVCSPSSYTVCVHRFLLISVDSLIVNMPFELPLSLFDGRSLVLQGDEDKVMAGDQQKGAWSTHPHAPPARNHHTHTHTHTRAHTHTFMFPAMLPAVPRRAHTWTCMPLTRSST